jgi:hypothetical protein
VLSEVTGGIDQILPVTVWDGGIDHIELTSYLGITKTYTIWGDEAETINLGTFSVADGNGIESTEYDDLTGILTITFDNGTITQTEDLRGDKGDVGDKGDKGETGNGIESIDYNNSTGILTITFDDGTTTQTGDIRGEQGIQGIQGIQGEDATALETIVVHLSDNVTPVSAGTSIELLTLRYDFTVTGVWFETPFQAPTGSAAIVRALANSVNIFTSPDALTIPANSTNVGPLIPNTTFLPSGTVLQLDIQQVGAINTGRGYRVTLQGTRS